MLFEIRFHVKCCLEFYPKYMGLNASRFQNNQSGVGLNLSHGFHWSTTKPETSKMSLAHSNYLAHIIFRNVMIVDGMCKKSIWSGHLLLEQ